MMNYIRDLRLIPIAVIACACLLALKAADLLLDGGSLIAGDNAPKMERTSVTRTSRGVPQPSSSMLSWASADVQLPRRQRHHHGRRSWRRCRPIG